MADLLPILDIELDIHQINKLLGPQPNCFEFRVFIICSHNNLEIVFLFKWSIFIYLNYTQTLHVCIIRSVSWLVDVVGGGHLGHCSWEECGARVQLTVIQSLYSHSVQSYSQLVPIHTRLWLVPTRLHYIFLFIHLWLLCQLLQLASN